MDGSNKFGDFGYDRRVVLFGQIIFEFQDEQIEEVFLFDDWSNLFLLLLDGSFSRIQQVVVIIIKLLVYLNFLQSILNGSLLILRVFLILVLKQKRYFSLLDDLVLEKLFSLSCLLNELHQLDVLVGLIEIFLAHWTLLWLEGLDALFAVSVTASQNHWIKLVILTVWLEQIVANSAHVFSVLLLQGDLVSEFLDLLLLLSMGRSRKILLVWLLQK